MSGSLQKLATTFSLIESETSRQAFVIAARRSSSVTEKPLVAAGEAAGILGEQRTTSAMAMVAIAK